MIRTLNMIVLLSFVIFTNDDDDDDDDDDDVVDDDDDGTMMKTTIVALSPRGFLLLKRHVLSPEGDRLVAQEFPEDALKATLSSCITLPIDFISLDDDMFELGLRDCYSNLHMCHKKGDYHDMVEQISEGLLNVLITCNLKPVIFAQKRVAERLRAKINEQLGRHIYSFEPTKDGENPEIDETPRPILVIADRIVDFPIMLHHHCEYRPLIHDCLGIHVNTVAIPTKQGKEDNFWCKNLNDTIPNVDEEVDPESPLRAELKQAFRGRILDAHMKIVTNLAEEIEKRGLDDFYEVESKILSKPHAPNIDAIEDLLSGYKIQVPEEDRVKISCTANDRMRLFLILYMCCSLEDELLQELFKYVRAGGSDTSVFSHLLHLKKMDANLDFGRPKGMVAGILSASTERLSLAGTANVQSSLARMVRQLVIQLQDALQERMERGGAKGRGDEKLPSSVEAEISRNFVSFDPFHEMRICDALADVTHAMVFVNGGGNFVEMMDIRKALDQVGVSSCYGTTDMISPDQFLHQLAICGKAG
ncbi:Sec1 family domain-containing protein 1B [Guillardia theta CCMP2712]|uniref:Sec1 family domain-containing protein 1B n=1 Tax=Guillardia theta (strain CCMP2712) TaxID=905079 RepID=L1IMD1_GUITC|nr:Sec1 family domain-containing protein 1B [Guillardia theta CCMP2712]EKX37252.1 Sec1 family domain-containing protein 1B [Guillardia theta CCMP2712]|eukprot:XP_005824232.1 Sec1 family domain-containing protein 1B [Guillardia theta CCMP2712]